MTSVQDVIIWQEGKRSQKVKGSYPDSLSLKTFL